MKIILYFLVFTLSFPLFSQAQNPQWEQMGFGIDQFWDVVEEFQGELFFGGSRYRKEGSAVSNLFATDGKNTRIIRGLIDHGYEGTIEAMIVRNSNLYISVRKGIRDPTYLMGGIFKFDGQQFTLLAERKEFGPPRDFTIFKDSIYIRGAFDKNSSVYDILIYRDTTWERLNLINGEHRFSAGVPLVINDTLKVYGGYFKEPDGFDANLNPVNQLMGIVSLTDTGWVQDKTITDGYGYIPPAETPFGKFSNTFIAQNQGVNTDPFRLVQTKSNNNEKWRSIGDPREKQSNSRVIYANESIFLSYMEIGDEREASYPSFPVGGRFYKYQDNLWTLFNEDFIENYISDYAYYKGYLYIVGYFTHIGKDISLAHSAKMLLDPAFDTKLKSISDNFIGHKNKNQTLYPVENDKYPTGQKENLSIQIIQSPPNGAAAIPASTLEIDYTPNQDFFGIDSILYSLCHEGLCDTTTITLRIKEKPNVPPVAQEDFFEFPDSLLGANQFIVGNLLDNDYSPDGDQIKLKSVRVWFDEYGEYALYSDGRLKIFTKNTTEKIIRLAYDVCDEEDSCSSTFVNFEFVPPVPPKNSAPKLEKDVFTVVIGEKSTLDVLNNDSDPENDSLYLKINTSPEHGLISLTPDRQQIVYEASFNYIGKESFIYTACDIAENCRNALVTIDVVEELPTFVNQNRDETSPYTLFPNPVQNTLNIKFTAPIKHGEIQIFTIAGQAILSEKLTPKSSHTLNLDALNKGIYLIQVNVNGKTRWDRFIKG